MSARKPARSKQGKKKTASGQVVLPDLQSEAAFSSLAVGFSSQAPVTESDAFRAYQSNLLSLISHELRTPLMGILNALGVLAENDADSPIAREELVRMAHKNALKLEHALSSLLSLAEVESGFFHARLREVELPRLVRLKLKQLTVLWIEKGLRFKEGGASLSHEAPVLADPQKIGRAVELMVHLISLWAKFGSEVRFEAAERGFSFGFELDSSGGNDWERAWAEAQTAFDAGVHSPSSVFAGVVQSENAFLTRTREGLGSELVLLQEILRIHHGQLKQKYSPDTGAVRLEVELNPLEDSEALRGVLLSRIFETSSGVGSVTLALVQSNGSTDFLARLRASLSRASDCAYLLSEGLVALVLADCRAQDAPKILERLAQKVGEGELKYGLASAPDEAVDPELLIDLAQKRLTDQKH